MTSGSRTFRRGLASTLIAAQALLGVGGGERVVFIGHDHGADEHCSGEHGHDHGALPGWLLYIPVVVGHGSHRSSGDDGRSCDHDHGRDHDDGGCRHAHVDTHDATAPRLPSPPKTPLLAALPAFFTPESLVPRLHDDAPRIRSVDAPPRPPDGSGATIRLLI